MRFKNYTHDAIRELEHQRMEGFSDQQGQDSFCDNGCSGTVLFDIGDRVLCEDCLIEEVRETLSELICPEETDSAACKVIQDIVSDFSDSEILTYIENRYEKL